jgi:tetratricopeptide (TPR) repeat protein
LNGDFLLGRYDYGLALYDLKRYPECLVQLAVIHRSEPDFDEGWLQYVMGTAAFQLKRFPQAAEHFQSARKLGRNETLLDRNLARCWMAQGKFGEATAAFHRFLKSQPDDWRAEMMLGDCYEHLSQMPAALTHWQRALDRIPNEAPESLHVRTKIRQAALSRPLPARREQGNPPPALRRGDSP